MRDLGRRDRVAGLLIISLPISDDEVAALERDGLPAVLVDTFHPRLPRVVIDNVHGGELAAAHLLAKGHRRSGSSETIPPTRTASPRARIAGAGSWPRWSVPGWSTTRALSASARTGATRPACWRESLLAHPDPPSAIFAASDLQAIGVLRPPSGSAHACRRISPSSASTTSTWPRSSG